MCNDHAGDTAGPKGDVTTRFTFLNINGVNLRNEAAALQDINENSDHSAGVPFDQVGVCVSLLMYTKRTRVRWFCRRCPPSNSFVVSSRALRPPFPSNWCLPNCFT
jgi:hypothetical protein